MMNSFPGFPPETLKFFRQLKRNNNREWFRAHKEIFDRKVKAPMIDLVLTLGSALQSFAPELITEPDRAIYRIYRDTRFSADKTPYKTHIAAHFGPRGVLKHAGAGLYFHIEPSEVLVAGGIYLPGPEELRLIRQHIADNWEELRAIIENRRFKKLFGGLEGEKLVRPPKGFSPEHPAIDLLRFKQWLVWVIEPPKLAESRKLFPRILTLFGAMMPLIQYLNAPLIHRFHSATAP